MKSNFCGRWLKANTPAELHSRKGNAKEFGACLNSSAKDVDFEHS